MAPVRSTSAGSPETWSACTWVSSTATIGDALGLGQRDVVVDEVDVGVDDRELAVALAAEQVGGARRLVVEELPEEHVEPPDDRWSGLTSYQVFY